MHGRLLLSLSAVGCRAEHSADVSVENSIENEIVLHFNLQDTNRKTLLTGNCSFCITCESTVEKL